PGQEQQHHHGDGHPYRSRDQQEQQQQRDDRYIPPEKIAAHAARPQDVVTDPVLHLRRQGAANHIGQALNYGRSCAKWGRHSVPFVVSGGSDGSRDGRRSELVIACAAASLRSVSARCSSWSSAGETPSFSTTATGTFWASF